ncbi:MAG: aldo/keto reductase [Mycobacteriales bacterium]
MTTTPAVPDAAVPLSGAGQMPLLGFGTWQITGDLATEATAWALEAGYRHVDTAAVYGNEREVGAALRGGPPRDDIFITTKVPPDRKESPRQTLEHSLEMLGTDHVDLWLIHWPPDRGVALDTWKALVEAQQQRLATAIGVSNYTLEQIDELAQATGVTPAVNQIPWSPLRFDSALVAGHRERGVVLEGYSALRGGTLKHPVITEIAERIGRTTAQVIIRWHLQHEIVVIPKSREQERIRSNADVAGFELATADMAALDALGGEGSDR